MLDIFSQYATDEVLERNGTWFPIKGGARLLVARANNDEHLRVLAELLERHREELDGDDEAAEKKNKEVMAEVVARAILKGWENLSFKGEPIEYSVANAKKLLAIKDFRKLVMGFANDMEAYRVKEEASQGKA